MNNCRIKKADGTTVAIRAIGAIFKFIYKMGYEQGVMDAKLKFISDVKGAVSNER